MIYIVFGILFLLLQGCNSNDDIDKFLQASDAAGLDLASLSVSADRLLVNAGESSQFTAVGVRKSGAADVSLTNNVDWQSSDPTIVSIDNNGLALARADGSAIIIARFANLQASEVFRVNTARLISVLIRGQGTINECLTQQLSASGEYSDGSERPLAGIASWSVSSDELATVQENSDGALLVTHQAGALQVKAASGGVNGVFDVQLLDTLQMLEIAPVDATLQVGDESRYTATGGWSDSTTADITASTDWTTTNNAVATFDTNDSGLLTAVADGSASVRAACGGVSNTVPVIVQTLEIDRVEMRPDESQTTLGVGDDGFQLRLRVYYTDGTTKDVTEDAEWTKSLSGAPTINVSNRSGTKGELDIKGVGRATIQATYKDFFDSILVIVE